MKRIIELIVSVISILFCSLISCSCSTNGLPINAAVFPDDSFRNYVLENCDTNRNGSLSPEEIETVTKVQIIEMGINDTTGIEHFTNLEELYCQYNSIVVLDVSENTNLKHLVCANNNIRCLDVSKNLMLEDLFCSSNELLSLDISHNANLMRLDCTMNYLDSLDTSENLYLTYLDCRYNRINELDFTNNPNIRKIDCSNNSIHAINLTGTSPTTLACECNPITYIDVTDCQSLLCLTINFTKTYLTSSCVMYCGNGVHILADIEDIIVSS